MIRKTGAPMTLLPSPRALKHTLWQVYSNRLWKVSNNTQTVASSLATHQDVNEVSIERSKILSFLIDNFQTCLKSIKYHAIVLGINFMHSESLKISFPGTVLQT